MGWGRRARVGAVAGGALVLAGCGFGITGEAVDVGHTSATLTGYADRTEPGDITYWFEYGETAEYSESTPARTMYTATGEDVEENVTGLDPHTTYHFRICVEDDQGHGTCGEDGTFTTTAPDDTVVGTAYSPPGVGVVLDLRSDRDGANPSGSVSYYFLDPGGFRHGDVTCLRVVGNRATIGFDATTPFARDAVIVVEHGTGGAGWDIELVDEAPTECPDPPTGPLALTGSAVAVTDTP